MEHVDVWLLEVFSCWYFYGLSYFSQHSSAKRTQVDPKSPIIVLRNHNAQQLGRL